MKYSLGISNFLEEISSLSHSVVFLYFFDCSLRKSFLSLFAVFWNSAFKWVYLSFSSLPFASLLFAAIYKASSNNHFAFLHFFFLGMALIPALGQCHEPPPIILQALCLSDLIPWIYFSLPVYYHKVFDLGHTWVASGLLYFLHSSVGKESACNAVDLGSDPGFRRSPGEGKGFTLQYSGLENCMDCIVHGVKESGMTEWLSLT